MGRKFRALKVVSPVDEMKYLILDGITDSNVVNKGVWNRDVLGGYFQNISKWDVH